MKKLLLMIWALCCLFLNAALSEDLTGTWGFAGGAEVHGDGFILHADGTGEWLEAMNYDLFPLREFLHTGNTFTWRVDGEGDRQYLIENYPDGREHRWEIESYEDGRIHIPEGDGGGFYWPVSAEEMVIADNPFDAILPLQTKTGSFTKNKKYEVYQGPGEGYGRSGGGKGAVSTNGPVYCGGTWDDWLLIEYEINADKHRYGWIRLDDLPQKQRDDYEPFAFSNDYGEFNYGVLIAGAALTDDPFYSKNAVAQMPAGTSVRVLAKADDYLLVNGFVGREMHMGFVHESYVDMKFGYAENTILTIDEAKTYARADILAAAEAVKDAVRKWFPGTSVVEIKYIEAESADADDWWQPEEENREGVQLFADLNGMSFYDYEIAAYGVAGDYGFILYRDKDGGAWEVCNWGYE